MKTGLDWLDTIPDLGNLFVSDGKELCERKRRVYQELAELRRDEAALWTKIAASGQWTRPEVTKALLKMEPDLLQYLPNEMPKKARRTRKSGET